MSCKQCSTEKCYIAEPSIHQWIVKSADKSEREMANLWPTLYFFLSLCCSCSDAGLQRVLVKGRIFCGIEPASNIKIKLFDEDVFWDDQLDQKFSNASGHFLLDGNTREYSNVDAFINIYHDCNDNRACQRRHSFYVPDKYINHGDRINTQTNLAELKIHDIGVINLESWIYGGYYERECFNELRGELAIE